MQTNPNQPLDIIPAHIAEEYWHLADAHGFDTANRYAEVVTNRNPAKKPRRISANPSETEKAVLAAIASLDQPTTREVFDWLKKRGKCCRKGSHARILQCLVARGLIKSEGVHKHHHTATEDGLELLRCEPQVLAALS